MNKELNVIFATNLDNFMRIKGVDRTQLCAELGFKYSTVSEWLSAKKYPRMDKIEMLAEYFGVKKSDLIEPSFPYEIQEYEPEPKYRIVTDKNRKKPRSEVPLCAASSGSYLRSALAPLPLLIDDNQKKLDLYIDFGNKETKTETKLPCDIKFSEDGSLVVDGAELLNYYNELNDNGKEEAIKRVKELTLLPDYKK